MQVEHFLEESATRFPDKTAIICGKRRITYRELDSQSNRLANALLAQGLQRYDRVVIYWENSIEAAITIFAILKARGVFSVINPTTKADKFEYILNNCRATTLITGLSKLEVLRESWTRIPHLQTIFVTGEGNLPDVDGKRFLSFERELGAASCTGPANRNIDIDLAALIYTSGSTGRPKGVMVTHQNVVSAATSITTYLENTADDIIISLLPLAFDYGLYQLLMSVRIGGTLLLERSFAYPFSVIERLISERVTGLPLVPTISSILLQLDLSKYQFPHLRYISNTAAALPTEHIRKLRQLFPNVKLYSMYGLTECKRVSYLPPDQIDIRPGSVGRGMPNEEVYIVDDAGNRVGAGVVGELVVRGANVMKGYWELPEETSLVLKDGPFFWPEKVLYTGDLFTSDEEGYLYWVGRKDDIIKTRGEKVSPKEVEDVIYSISGVSDVAVIGVPDELLGSAVKAFIKLLPNAGTSAQDVLAHCKQHLEDFMVPKYVEIVENLPQTATGKISKRALTFNTGGGE